MTEMEKAEQRAKKYGCDGNCYTGKRICPRIDYCPETRTGEFIASVVAMLVCLLALPVGVVALIYHIIGILY